MKGQINVEFLAAALLYMLVLGSILTIGSDALPDFSEDASRASLNTEAYKLTTQMLKEPGYSTAYGGTTAWHDNAFTVTNTVAFGLTDNSEDFNRIDESKLNKLESFDRNPPRNFSYDDFKNVTGVENQYLFNFTLKPILLTEKTFTKDLSRRLGADLAAYYPLEETSGAVKDISGNNNDGTNNGAVRGVSGKFHTNGTNFYYGTNAGPNTCANDCYMSMPDSKDFSMHEDFTATAWVKYKEGANDDHIIFGKGNHSDEYWEFSTTEDGGGDDDRLRFKIDSGLDNDDAETYYSTQSLKEDTWHHVALIRRGNKIEFFIDGESAGVASKDLNEGEKTVNPTGPFAIGSLKNAETEGWNGTIDEVRVYNKSLNSEELQQLMETPAVVREPDDSEYESSENEVHYGKKKIGSKRYHAIQVSHEGLYDTAYLSDSWNFTNADPKGVGESFSLHGSNLKVSSFQNRDQTPGSMLVLSKHLKEFGPNVDSDSTVIRLDRYALLNGEPLQIKVLVW